MARLDVRLDEERRRRLEELVEERGVPISAVVRCLIDDAYEDIVRVRRKQAVERLIGLNVEDPSLTRTPSPASWRPPMSPAVFIDANVPIYAAGGDHPIQGGHVPAFSVWRQADPQPFVTDSEVLQELMHRYLASGRWALGRRSSTRLPRLWMAGSNLWRC